MPFTHRTIVFVYASKLKIYLPLNGKELIRKLSQNWIQVNRCSYIIIIIIDGSLQKWATTKITLILYVFNTKAAYETLLNMDGVYG